MEGLRWLQLGRAGFYCVPGERRDARYQHRPGPTVTQSAPPNTHWAPAVSSSAQRARRGEACQNACGDVYARLPAMQRRDWLRWCHQGCFGRRMTMSHWCDSVAQYWLWLAGDCCPAPAPGRALGFCHFVPTGSARLASLSLCLSDWSRPRFSSHQVSTPPSHGSVSSGWPLHVAVEW